MSSMVQVLDVGCPLHFLARKDLQILQEMKIQERWGLLLSSLTIAIFWCNNLLVLAQNPFIQAKPEKISYVLILWLSNAISQCLPVTHKATPPWCCENLQQQSNTCAEDTLATDPPEGTAFPFPGVALPNLVFWNSDVRRWLRHRHALPPGEFDGSRTAGTSGWLVHTVVVAGAHASALRHDACTMRSDSRGLTETSVICSWGCSWLVADFQRAITFCYLEVSLGVFVSILGKKSENHLKATSVWKVVITLGSLR